MTVLPNEGLIEGVPLQREKKSGKTPTMKVEPVLSRHALLEILDDRAEPITFLQNRPYTCVQIRTWYNQKEYIGFGFSKVMWPDQWDAEQGAEIAMKHALIMVMHQIRIDENNRRNITDLLREHS